MTCKGGFDNGLVSEHEHTANCRLCLLERITELTAEVGRRISDNLQHREREVALHARVQELEREVARLKGYTLHRPDCDISTGKHKRGSWDDLDLPGDCTCGLG